MTSPAVSTGWHHGLDDQRDVPHDVCPVGEHSPGPNPQFSFSSSKGALCMMAGALYGLRLGLSSDFGFSSLIGLLSCKSRSLHRRLPLGMILVILVDGFVE